jgi:hypothetical protein
MAKSSKKASTSTAAKVAAAPVPQGKKKTFTEADLDELDFDDMEGSFHSSDDDMTGLHSSDEDGPSDGESGSEGMDEDDGESDEDGAPEEETLAHGKEGEQERRREADQLDKE